LGALLVGTAAAQDHPRVETFLGYTYVRLYPQNVSPALSANGGRGEFVFNFNRWLGGVLDAGAVTNNNFSGFDISNTQAFFMAGPRVTFHRSRFKPYGQAVFGGVYYTASTPVVGIGPIAPPILISPEPITARAVTAETKFAMAMGLGLDIKLTRWLAFRPGAVDYYYTRIGNYRSLGDNSQNGLRYSAGLNFMFGGEKPAPAAPPPPQTKKCPDGSVVSINDVCPKMNAALSLTANPAELCPGETAQVTATGNGVDLNQFQHMWSVNGQPAGQDKSFTFTGKDPGTYTIGLNVSNDKFNPASAQTTIVVREYVPPSGTVQANPAQIYVGDKSSLSANFTGQCGGPIQSPRFTASEGSIEGDQFDSTTVQFDPSNTAEQRKTVTITAKAADDRSEGTATTTIEVIKKSTAAAVRLPDVLFSRNNARVNNCGKRVLLEQLRSYYERDSSGTVVLVGHQSPDETVSDLSNQRVLNAAAVITAGSGVCLSIPQSQVQVSAPGTDQQGVDFDSSFCASSVPASPSAGMRRVAVWFVPNGAPVPPSVTGAQPASATTVGSLGCPK
jgi:hypothetical protein